MELDGYETDLSDYHLQETPFYESQTLDDIDMLRAPEKFVALRPSPVGGIMSGVGSVHDAQTPIDVAVTVLSMPPTTNKKKRVTFLPNFVQVSSAIFDENVFSELEHQSNARNELHGFLITHRR